MSRKVTRTLASALVLAACTGQTVGIDKQNEGGTGVPVGGALGDAGSATVGGASGGALPVGGSIGTGGGSASGGGCGADLDTSSANCGRCGHDCGIGSTCRSGLCTPVTVLPISGALPTPASILLDGARFYYHRYDSTVGYFVPTSTGFFSTTGGATTTLSTADERSGYALSQYTWDKPLALDDANAYWFAYLANDHGHLHLRTAPKDASGAASTLVLLTLADSSNQGPVGMAVDAQNVYWLAENDGLYSFPKTGPASVTPTPLQALPGESSEGLVLDSGSLYWASTVNGQIWRYLISGGNPPSFVDAPESGATVCGLVIEGTTMYWAQCGAPYGVHRVGIDGTGSVLLASPLTDSGIAGSVQGGVVVDQDYAYFLGTSYVHRVPKAGGQEQAIGYTLPTTGGDRYAHRMVGVDAQYVYFLDLSVPSVLRLAK